MAKGDSGSEGYKKINDSKKKQQKAGTGKPSAAKQRQGRQRRQQ